MVRTLIPHLRPLHARCFCPACCAGTCIRTSNAARKLCEQTTDYPLYFTAGVHPHNAKTCNRETMDTLRQLAAHPRCAAIGEAGLDFNRNFSPQPVQVIRGRRAVCRWGQTCHATACAGRLGQTCCDPPAMLRGAP